MRRFYEPLLKYICIFSLLGFFMLLSFQAAQAQELQSQSGLKPLRSDVGINGFTANFSGLSSFHNLANDTLHYDGSRELEIVFHDIRMMSPRLGVGFQVLGSFYTNSHPAPGHSGFGFGGFGLGPMVRLYPFFTDRFQPYIQAKALLGDNMGVGKLDNTKHRGRGFRIRLGLRAGFSVRIINNFGLFVDAGPDWESSALFKADAMAWQINIGFDVYRFR
jgi:hypothetical protein